MDRILEQDRAGQEPVGLRHYKDPPMGHARVKICSVDLKQWQRTAKRASLKSASTQRLLCLRAVLKADVGNQQVSKKPTAANFANSHK
jgi:hypothetical protein